MPTAKQNQPHNNPYASAAGAYGNNAQKSASSPRELEARVLLKSAQSLLDLKNNWESRGPDDLEERLKYNRNVWLIFLDNAQEDKSEERSASLRTNIINLANFVFKREVDLLLRPEKNKLDILISINREIATGLMKNNEPDVQRPVQGMMDYPEKTEITTDRSV